VHEFVAAADEAGPDELVAAETCAVAAPEAAAAGRDPV
jgi:hypothetical protein